MASFNLTMDTISSAMDTISSRRQAAAAVRPPPGLTLSSTDKALQMDVFHVRLQKAARGKLGISVAAVPVCGLSAAGLVVTEIQAGGAADMHNHTCPSVKSIRPGDVIVGANDAKLNANLMHEVLAEVATSMSEQLVELCFLRQLVKLNTGTMPRSSQTTLVKSPKGKQDGSAFRSMAPSQASTDVSCASSPSTSTSQCSSVDNLPILQAVAPKKKGQKKGAKTETKTEAPMKTDVAQGKPTTIMLGQLPGSFTRARLEALLDQIGFAGLYDFTYVPTNLRTGAPFHYAFVNLVDGDAAVACKDALDGHACESGQDGEMTTAWATSQQGQQANIMRYRDSPIMHESVPDESKPALFYRGARVAFPLPAKALKAPPQKRRQVCPPEVQDVPLPYLF
jgi:hypothetical protein